MQKARKDRTWVDEAVRIIAADFDRSADTHLIRSSFQFSTAIPMPASQSDLSQYSLSGGDFFRR
jgi:hypothetical protein